MNNFEACDRRYRERVMWLAVDWVGDAIRSRIKSGARFDAKVTVVIFNDSIDYAKMITDLEISSGLNPLKEEDDCAKCDFGASDSKGSTSDGGDEVRVCNPVAPTESVGDNGSAGGGEVIPPEQQPTTTQP